MQFRLIPVIFYSTLLITLVCQLVALDLFPSSPVDPAPENRVSVSEPLIWEVTTHDGDEDPWDGQEVSADRLFDLLDSWSEPTRAKLAGLLMDRPHGECRVQLAFREGPATGEVHYVQLSAHDVRSILSVLHVHS